jgi:hypothetical protein
MDKGGRPCGKSAATLKREREAEEKANPETRQRRMEDESFRRMNFFAGHTRAPVSSGVWGERWGLQEVPKGFSADTVQQQRGAKN